MMVHQLNGMHQEAIQFQLKQAFINSNAETN